MIRNVLFCATALAVIATAPVDAATKRKTVPAASAALPASNPFAKPSTLPLETPDFSKIKDSDYLPALLAGMEQQKREITAIANQKATPTFENTVAAMERSGLLLERAGLAFNAVNGANTNDTLQATDTKTSPLFAAHNDFIYLNEKLFQRFKYLHDHQAELNLNPEQAKLLDVYYKQFVHAGRNSRLPSRRSSRRSTSNSARSRPRSARSCLPQRRPALCMSMTRPPSPAFLRNSSPRRRKLQRDARCRLCHPTAEHDAAALARIADQSRHAAEVVRSEPQSRGARKRQRHSRDRQQACAAAREESGAVRAPNFADYNLYDQMAKDRATAVGFLDRLAPAVASRSARMVRHRRACEVRGATFQPTAADWNYYAEQIRKQRYALSSDELKPISSSTRS
jgi:peptidyl-dipeptidase Dcp